MSLINDALKKAQRQRTGDHSPTAQPPMPGGGPVPARPARTGNGSNPQLLLIGAGALLGLAIAGGTVFFLRDNRPASEPVPVAPVENATPTKVAAEPPATLLPPSTSAVAPKTEPTVVTKTEPAPDAIAAAPIAANEPVTAKPAPEAPPPSLRMIEAVEALRVAGIRASAGSDAKVLMNDRVYRLGDTVDHALGIKLTGVTASSLTFRDPSGATYTRNF